MTTETRALFSSSCVFLEKVKQWGYDFTPCCPRRTFHSVWMKAHDARCCKTWCNPCLEKASQGFCAVSRSSGAAEAIKNPPVSLHYSSCPLLDWWLRAQLMKQHQESPGAPTQNRAVTAHLQHPRDPRRSLFINSFSETAEKNNKKALPIMTSSSYSTYFQSVEWSSRWHKVSLSFGCHHPSCSSQEETTKWMPLYSF